MSLNFIFLAMVVFLDVPKMGVATDNDGSATFRSLR